jgi:hypothetical protein
MKITPTLSLATMTQQLITKQLINTRKRNQRANNSSAIVLPFGKSYLDLLPEDVTHRIFKMKHGMEFKPTVLMINQFKFAFEGEHFKTRMSIRSLLTILTKRKLFHLDVEQYEGDLVFNADKDVIKNIENEYNVNVNMNKPNDPLNMLSYHNSYTDVRIKWKQPRYVLVLDIICLTNALGLNSVSTCYVLEALHVDDINRKKDDITFEFVC